MNKIIQALAVAAEVTGTTLTEAALNVMARKLAKFPESHALAAIDAAMGACKYRLTLADILEHIPAGRPTASEAWAIVPKDERESAVLPAEAMTALGVANSLIHAGDMVAARMAFIEAYNREVQESKFAQKPVKYVVLAGWDAKGREDAVKGAVRDRKLSITHAKKLMPELDTADILGLENKREAPELLEKLGENLKMTR